MILTYLKFVFRFCVVKSKPDRKKRMAAAVSILEGRCEMEKGEVMAFINFQEKTWFLVLECFPKNKLDSKIAEMKEKGFRHFKKEISKPEEPVDNKQHFRRPPPIKTKSQNVPVEFEIFDGLKWTFNVSDDLKANLDSDYMENKDLQYYKHLPESLRKFVIEPKTTEERTLIGAINLTPVGINDQKVREASTMALRIEVDEETVKAYFHEEVIPEEPEVKKEKPNLDLLRTPEIKVDKPTTPFTPKFKPLPASVMERLMRTSRPQIISKHFFFQNKQIRYINIFKLCFYYLIILLFKINDIAFINNRYNIRNSYIRLQCFVMCNVWIFYLFGVNKRNFVCIRQ